jgi:hypothetical protein
MQELMFPEPVSTSEDLFDRKHELKELYSSLSSSKPNALVIMGERLTGKTSLLNVTLEWATSEEGRYKVVMLSSKARSRNEFAAELVTGIGKVTQDVMSIGQESHAVRSRSQTVTDIAWTLRELLALAPSTHILVCVEELDALIRDSPGRVGQEIAELIRYMLAVTDLPLAFLFTMTQPPQELLMSYASPFLTSSRIVRVGPWLYNEARQFVTWLLARTASVTLLEVEHQAIYDAAGGNPYFTKAILHTLLNHYATADVADRLEQAIANALELSEVQVSLHNIFHVHLSEVERELMHYLASRYEGTSGLTEEEAQEQGIAFRKAAIELEQRGYLRRNGQNHWVLRLGLLGRWLKQVDPYSAGVTETSSLAVERQVSTMPASPGTSDQVFGVLAIMVSIIFLFAFVSDNPFLIGLATVLSIVAMVALGIQAFVHGWRGR